MNSNNPWLEVHASDWESNVNVPPDYNNDFNSKIKSVFSNLKNRGFDPCQNTYLKQTKDKGLGVFAKRDLEQYEVIEICHAVLLSKRRNFHSDLGIMKYAYWHTICKCKDCLTDGPHGMLLFGNGSIYNSATSIEEANADFFTILELPATYFIAKKNIKKEEEILTWWGQDYYNAWCKKNTKEEG